MKHPWEEIDLSVYEKHMSWDSIGQLQAMNDMMKDQFYAYPAQTVMILGIAGGNGLEHIDKQVIKKVYGVDINESFLNTCERRYPELHGVLETIHVDLTQFTECLPYADLLIANLLIEYIGYDCFQRIVKRVEPRFVSCVLQLDTDASFVSASPYIHAFDRLEEVHCRMEEAVLGRVMEQIGYRNERKNVRELPNGKMLVRVDFEI